MDFLILLYTRLFTPHPSLFWDVNKLPQVVKSEQFPLYPFVLHKQDAVMVENLSLNMLMFS